MEAAMEAAKKDQKVAAVTRIIQQPADASETVQEEAAPNTGPTTAPSISGATSYSTDLPMCNFMTLQLAY
jgi:hypothetical protein